jgi:hypothetical protein
MWTIAATSTIRVMKSDAFISPLINCERVSLYGTSSISSGGLSGALLVTVTP